MSSSISIKIANVTATVTVGANITDQQVGQALTRYAQSLGIPITGDAQTDLTAILTHIVDDTKRRAKQVQISAAQTASLATAQAQADSDNAL